MSSEQTCLSIGILGTASIATRSILPALQRMQGTFKVHAIASRSLSKAEAVAADTGAVAYGFYEELLEDPAIDAVYIPLPTGLHSQWVLRALAAGKHVLCEKSLGGTLEETREMVALASERGLALVENFQFRFHSQLQTLRQFVGLDGTEGRIGEVRSVRCSFGFPPFPDADNIRYSSELGGGALLDAGAYTLKISTLLLGPSLQVQAASLITDPALGVDLHGSGFLLDPETGLASHVAFGFDHFYQCGVEIWGTKGRLRTNRLFTARADFSPIFELETQEGGLETVSLPPDDHFVNMLTYFHSLCSTASHEARALEYRETVLQATLLQSFRDLANAVPKTNALT